MDCCRPTTARPAVATLSEESGRLSDEIKVVADEANNSLLILATPSDYEKIRNALERLDIVPLQVLIEATIIEVELVDAFQFGLQWFFDQYYGGGYTGTSALTNSSGGIPGEGPQFSAQGFAWTLLSGSNTVKAVLTALAEDSLANVLSSPSVMVLDNQSARIQVGDQVAIGGRAQRVGRAVGVVAIRELIRVIVDVVAAIFGRDWVVAAGCPGEQYAREQAERPE